MLLAGKVALITGSASGIGRATAQLFAREGAKIAVADIDEAGGRETVESIRMASGEAFFVEADVGEMDQVQAMVELVSDHYGRIDIVHSNAYSQVRGDATEITEADWDRTLDVCLKATWMIAHHTVPVMSRNGGGVMVVTGSVHSIRGFQRFIPYDAAKGGLLALTRALAADHCPEIRVNAILPGSIDVRLSRVDSDAERDRNTRTYPLQRRGLPEDIANAALFLASDMSSYMTGTFLVVDGGLTSIIQDG